MLPSTLTTDGPEYVARTQTAFTPPDVDLQALRKAVPNDAFRRSTWRALVHLAPILTTTALFFVLGWHIDGVVAALDLPTNLKWVLKWTLWTVYWNVQAIAWAGFFTIGKVASSRTRNTTHPLSVV